MKKLALCAMILAGASTAANAQQEGILAGIGTTGAVAGAAFLGFVIVAVTGTTTATTTTAP